MLCKYEVVRNILDFSSCTYFLEFGRNLCVGVRIIPLGTLLAHYARNGLNYGAVFLTLHAGPKNEGGKPA